MRGPLSAAVIVKFKDNRSWKWTS